MRWLHSRTLAAVLAASVEWLGPSEEAEPGIPITGEAA
jgi:hypothetical protein